MKINFLKNNSFRSIVILGLVFGAFIGLSVGTISAFRNASTTAPTNPSDLAVPISTNSDDQTKEGGFSLGNLKDNANDPQTSKLCVYPDGKIKVCTKQ